MPTMTVSFQAFCKDCGGLLTAQPQNVASGWRVHVAPCPACIEKAREESGTDGYDRGSEDGEEGGQAR